MLVIQNDVRKKEQYNPALFRPDKREYILLVLRAVQVEWKSVRYADKLRKMVLFYVKNIFKLVFSINR